jgi:hypothetical protein
MTNLVDTNVLKRLIVKAVEFRRNVKGDSFATIEETAMLVADPLTVIDADTEMTRAIVTTLLGVDCSEYAGCIDFQIWDGSRGNSEIIAYFRRDDSNCDDANYDCDDYAVRNLYTTFTA